jgi:hypothetical protein
MTPKDFEVKGQGHHHTLCKSLVCSVILEVKRLKFIKLGVYSVQDQYMTAI